MLTVATKGFCYFRRGSVRPRGGVVYANSCSYFSGCLLIVLVVRPPITVEVFGPMQRREYSAKDRVRAGREDVRMLRDYNLQNNLPTLALIVLLIYKDLSMISLDLA